MLVDLIDKLTKLIIELIKHRKQSDRELFNDYIEPIFKEFDEIHNAYLESFDDYRTILKDPIEPKLHTTIPLRLEKDNLFTDSKRNKLHEQLKSIGEDKIVGKFVLSIYQYLNKRYMETWFPQENRENFSPQRWRRSLLEKLTYLFEEDWWRYFEVMQAEEYLGEDFVIEKELDNRCRKYNISLNDNMRTEKLKSSLAIEALDSVVSEMQGQYKIVVTEYYDLKKKLLR